MPNFLPSPLGSIPPSKKLLPEVEKLRRAVQRGAMERRSDVVDKLGKLAVSYSAEGRYDDALKAWDEVIELTETLLEEGKLEITQTMIAAVFPITSLGRVYALQHKAMSRFNEDAFLQRLQKCLDMLPEEEFLQIKNEWALDIHQRAESLHQNGATIAAIASLDNLLGKMEPLFNPKTPQFTEWRPLLQIYRSRGLWKCEIGDHESGIADLLRYEKLAQSANEVLQKNMAVTRKKNSSPSLQDGKLVIRMYAEDFVDFFASYNFHEERYDALLQLANAYAGRAEKETALEYFDKALRGTTVDESVRDRSRFSYFAAPMDIPYRKGHLLAQFHQFEQALEQFDLAIENVKELLQLDREEFLAELEHCFAEVSRAKAEALRSLGRFDEAKDSVEMARQFFVMTLKAVENSRDAEEDDEDDENAIAQSAFLQNLLGGPVPFQGSTSPSGGLSGLAAFLAGSNKDDDNDPLSMKNLLASPTKRKEKSLRKAVREGEEFDERKVLLQFGALHNEAMMDVERGKIEMHAGNWRKALRYLLKARFVVDSPIIVSFPEAKKNILNIYNAIAKIYTVLKEYEKAQTWYERTVNFARKLIDEGDEDARTIQYVAHEGFGDLYSEMQRYDKASVEYATAFSCQVRLIEAQEAALEGLDRERLRVHDNQKLMPLAVLYRAQIETVRRIENQIFAKNSPGAAESWARIEKEAFENFRALLLRPEQANEDCLKTTASCIAMLRWAGEEEKVGELLGRWLADLEDQFENKEHAQNYINVAVAMRLKDLYALTDFRDGAKLFGYTAQQLRSVPFPDGYETARVFRSLLVYEQRQLQDPPPVKHDFYDHLIALIDHEVLQIRDDYSIDEEEGIYCTHPYDPNEVQALLDKIEDAEDEAFKEDEPDEDENAALYERDFEDAFSNKGMLFKMMDAYSGNNVTDELLEDEDRRRGTVRNEGSKVGRNDPCPCGSGKKYKKCCLNK